ncbi:hypothetical protein LD39_10545 [Halobacillus sp. BBL2006]|nr:hypothetical protein LD39_10545 [Halobacillus sp. BBL2006]
MRALEILSILITGTLFVISYFTNRPILIFGILFSFLNFFRTRRKKYVLYDPAPTKSEINGYHYEGNSDLSDDDEN